MPSRHRRVLTLIAAFAAVATLGAVTILHTPGHTARALGAGGAGQSLCIAHHPQPDVWYTQSCTGHDEPELDPISSRAGSAKDIT